MNPSNTPTPKTSHFFSILLGIIAGTVIVALVGLFFYILLNEGAGHSPHVEPKPTIVTNLVPKTGFGKELHGNIGYVTRKGFNGGIAPLFDPGSSDLGEQWDQIKRVIVDVLDPSMLPPITIQVVSREFVLEGTNMVPYHGQAGFRTTLPAGIIVTYPPGSQFR